MNYYVRTDFFDRSGLVTSGGKGRDDYFEMLRRSGLECISIKPVKTEIRIGIKERFRLEIQLNRSWKKALKKLGKGDILFIHNPPSEKFMGFTGIIKKTRKRGCRIVTIVFDLEDYLKPYFGKAGKLRYLLSLLSERSVLKCADHIMVQNDSMKKVIAARGFDPKNITGVGVMDYLRDEKPDIGSIKKRTGRSMNIVFCGNLIPEKAGFLSDFPGDLDMDLYGPGYNGDSNNSIHYKGSFPSIEIMDVISGSFGLVWDGSSSHEVSGACGEYLRMNSPHKMALYLASGMPVIVWDESAMADFVHDENCGFAVRDLTQIRPIIDSMTDDEYAEKRDNAIRVAAGIRKGIHLQGAIEKILQQLEKEQD